MANVMVVDDALFMRMTIKKMLEAHGHTVVGEAGNGVEAVKRYAEIKPDIVMRKRGTVKEIIRIL